MDLLAPLQFMGMNAILIFFFHGTASALIDQLYIATPKPGGGTLHVCKMNGISETPCTLTWWVHEELLAFIADDATPPPRVRPDQDRLLHGRRVGVLPQGLLLEDLSGSQIYTHDP